jgi:putative membrane protein
MALNSNNKPNKMDRPLSNTQQLSIYPLILLAIYSIVWIALALAPLDRHDWMLENVLVLIAVPLVILRHRKQPFSNTTYTMLWIFMLLHAIGAHYTYAKVPYDEWTQTLTGHRLNDLLGFERNHFDRLVHFLYGVLWFPLYWELFAPRINGSPALRYLLVMTFLMSHAGIYEVVEWGAAAFFGGDLGVAYLGTQGDEWDAQKDMGLAMAGTLLIVLIMGLFRVHHDSDGVSTNRQPAAKLPPSFY